jgi:hypothetical protein
MKQQPISVPFQSDLSSEKPLELKCDVVSLRDDSESGIERISKLEEECGELRRKNVQLEASLGQLSGVELPALKSVRFK